MTMAPATRSTRQRSEILTALNEAKGFRSAQEIHADLRRRGAKTGLATVYRHLQSLAESGGVDVVRDAEREAKYRLCESGKHHHHLVCRSCGSAEAVGDPGLERWAEATAGVHGYTQVTHSVELFGRCPNCRKDR